MFRRAAFTLAVMLGASVHVYAKDLTGAEIKQAFVGKKLSFAGAAGSGNTVYSPNGNASIVFRGKPDKGKWRIKGSRMCVTWTWISRGEGRLLHRGNDRQQQIPDVQRYDGDGSLAPPRGLEEPREGTGGYCAAHKAAARGAGSRCQSHRAASTTLRG